MTYHFARSYLFFDICCDAFVATCPQPRDTSQLRWYFQFWSAQVRRLTWWQNGYLLIAGWAEDEPKSISAACNAYALPSPYRTDAVLAKSKALVTESKKFGTACEHENQCISAYEEEGKDTVARPIRPPPWYPPWCPPYHCTPQEAEQSYRVFLQVQTQAPIHIAELALGP